MQTNNRKKFAGLGATLLSSMLLLNQVYAILPQQVSVSKQGAVNNFFAAEGVSSEISLSNPRTWHDGVIHHADVSAPRNLALNNLQNLGLQSSRGILKVASTDSKANYLSYDSVVAYDVINKAQTNLAFAQRAGLVLKQARNLLPQLNNLDLRLNKTILNDTKNFRTYRFDRFIEGQQVEGAYLKVLTGQTQLLQIEDFTYAAAPIVSENFSVEQALNVVVADAKLQESESLLNDGLESFRAVMAPNGKVEIVPVVTFKVAKENPLGEFEYAVSRNNGAIISLHNNFLFLESGAALKQGIKGKVSAQVYPRTPNDKPVETLLPFTSVGTAGKKLYTDEKGEIEFSGLKLKSSMPGVLAYLAAIPVTAQLKGLYVNIKNSSGKDGQITQDVGADFNLAFANSNSTMAERMTNQNVTLVRNWAKRYAPNVAWLDKELPTNVNLNQTCNAYWNGSSINFFQKGSSGSIECNNTGEISDVVFHEWGHGFHANTSGIKDGAFSEGIGDIVSMLQTHSPLVGPYFMTSGREVRDLRKLAVYPKDKGEVHAEGVIIGGTFWDLYLELQKRYPLAQANDILSRWTISMIRGNSSYTTVYRHLTALDVTETKGSKDKGTHFCALNAAFARHGLAQKDNTCLGALNIKEISFKREGSSDVYLPGSTVNVQLLVENNSSADVKNLVAELSANPSIDLLEAKVEKPVLAANQSAKFLMSFRIKRTATCGQSIKIDARLSALNNDPKIASGTILIGAGSEQEFTGVSDLPAGGMNIPNNAREDVSVNFNVQAPVGSKITNVELDLNLRHDWTQDLKIGLVSPSGDLFKVWDRQRSYGDGINQKFSTNKFNDTLANGKWVLTVLDTESGSDSGRILKVGLKVKSQSFQCK